MKSDTSFDLKRAVAELGDPSTWKIPDGYPTSLALCALDSIWSLGVRYSSVLKVVDTYLDLRDITGESRRLACADTPADFLAWYRSCGDANRAADALSNRQKTSTRGGILKVEAVAQACAILVDADVLRSEDLEKDQKDLKKRWTNAVHGQRSGLSWTYFLMLAGVPGVKADRMVVGFLQRFGASRVDDPHGLITDMQRELELDHLSLSVIDHRFWTVEREWRRRRGD